MARFKRDLVYSGTGYYGNEASPTDFYTHAAIIINMPSLDDINIRKKLFEQENNTNANISQDALISTKHLIGFKDVDTSEEQEIKLFENNFIPKKREFSGMNDYSTRTVKELKELCREYGLKVSGTKDELILRLESFNSQSII